MKPKFQRTLAVLFIAAALGFLAMGAEKCPGEIPPLSTPFHPIRAALTEFTLTEVDRKTLEPLSAPIPAKVPGDIFTALLEARRIKDPYVDMNSRELAWVDDRAWRYETEFNLKPTPGSREHLLFMGIDYLSKIELNGKLLENHEGMFTRIDLDVTDMLLPSGKQKLAVTITGVPGTSGEWLGPLLSSNEFGRRNYLKTQMSFGWDFAPRLKGGGIWDRVYLYQTGALEILDLFAVPSLDGKVTVQADIEGTPAEDLEMTVQVELQGSTDEGEVFTRTFTLKKGEPIHTLVTEIQVDNPKLWWPWDMGEQNLYTVYAALRKPGDGDNYFSFTGETFAFREIKWGPNPGAPEGAADWVLFINGKREFIRGANWVPPESMYGRMTDERYEKLIDMAKAVGVNCLRVWGGGNRERRAFYDYCDKKGIMVWQEFPFACVYLVGYPRDQDFKALVRQETFEIVKQLRNHPSIIMWCGGNEFNAVQNKHVVDIMAEATAIDPTRRFIPASPYKGDSHNWVVWHMQGNLDDYFDDISPLPSEFGLQAFPALDTLKKWISPQHLTPKENPVLVHHDLGPSKMEKYISAIGHDGTMEGYIAASQLMQSHYLQRGIEHWRQRKYATSGTAFWQLNEPWPAICWSVIDYELTPKRAYYTLQNTYNPLLVSIAFADRAWKAGDKFEAEIIVVNDLHQTFPGAVIRASVCGQDAGSWTADVPEDNVLKAGKLETDIPADCMKPFLDLTLEAGGEAVSKNHYELWVYDGKPAGKFNRNLEKIGKYFMSGAKQTQWEE